MRQDCESCGDFVECNKQGICAECVLEGYTDETAETPEEEKDKEA